MLLEHFLDRNGDRLIHQFKDLFILNSQNIWFMNFQVKRKIGLLHEKKNS